MDETYRGRFVMAMALVAPVGAPVVAWRGVRDVRGSAGAADWKKAPMPERSAPEREARAPGPPSAAQQPQCWSAAPSVTWLDVPGELMLFDSRADTYHVLNRAAASIWRLVAAGARVETVTARLSERHGVPAAQMSADVAACVDDLAARGLIVPGSER